MSISERPPSPEKAQDFSKSTSLGTGLATCTFQRQGRFGNGRPWPNGSSEPPEGHAGPLRWPHRASEPRRPKLDSRSFASTPTGLLSPRFFQKSLAHVHAQPHARTCSPHDFPSLDGKWASWRFRHAGVSCMSEAAFSCMCPLVSAAHHVTSR